MCYSVSCTSRSIRKGEVEGADYRFVSEDEFKKKVREDEFLEWAMVHGAYYGTPRSPVMKAFENERNVLLDIDVQGARQVRKRVNQGVFIFVLPPDRRELARRLRGRKTEREEMVERRLHEAGREVQDLVDYDYLVVNSDLGESVSIVEEIIKVEKYRVQRLRGAEAFMESFQYKEE